MMLCAMTLMCYSQCGCWRYLCSYVARGFGTARSLLYLVENRAPMVVIQSQVWAGFVKSISKFEHMF